MSRVRIIYSHPLVRRLLIVFLIVLLASASYRMLLSEETGTGTLTLAQPAPTPGEQAPTFTAERSGEDMFALDSEGIYVLTFWSELNEGSDSARPGFTDLAREYDPEEVSFAAVYVGSIPPDTEEAPYAVLRDTSGRLSSLYNVKRVPRLFVISDGRIVLVQNGYFSENEEQLEETLDELLGERAQ